MDRSGIAICPARQAAASGRHSDDVAADSPDAIGRDSVTCTVRIFWLAAFAASAMRVCHRRCSPRKCLNSSRNDQLGLYCISKSYSPYRIVQISYYNLPVAAMCGTFLNRMLRIGLKSLNTVSNPFHRIQGQFKTFDPQSSNILYHNSSWFFYQ